MPDPKLPADEQEDPPEQIEVPPEETPETGREVNPDEEDQVEKELKALDNKAFAAMRKEASEAKRERDELRKQMAAYQQRIAQPERAPYVAPASPVQQREMIGGIPVPQTKAEWDALARQDWQTAVDLRSIMSARKVQEEVRRVDTNTRALEESKQRVLSKHPELADDNSEKTQIFKMILDKNPDYLTMSKGPVLAMRDMEDELESRGYTREQIFDSKKVVARNEAERVTRAALTGGGRMPEKTGRSVQLSQDDLEFCKGQGIDPKDYAREKLAHENSRKGAQL